MQQKPKLSFWQIWNMSFGFLGIQFGYALQGGFMSRIFETQVPMSTVFRSYGLLRHSQG